MIRGNFFSPMEPGIFEPLVQNLTGSDPFFVCADFDSYCTIQEKISADYEDEAGWTEKSILNVSRSGRFSSDRTISEYARDIWKIPFEKSR
jgi:starch phosphorylase